MDRGKAIPFYLQVAETLRSRIRDGRYPVGEFLPSHQELEEEFRVSNITIRKALLLLVQEGSLQAQRGRAARVAERPPKHIEIEIARDFKGFTDSVLEGQPGIATELLEISLSPGHRRIAELLGVPAGKPLWRMKRVRKMHGEPVSYFVNYARPELYGRIGRRDAAAKRFIDLFRQVTDLRLSKMEQRVYAVMADMDVSALLGIPYADPLLFVETLYFSPEERVEEVTHMYFRADRYAFKATLPF
jgi:GntR family transcriptional regulator